MVEIKDTPLIKELAPTQPDRMRRVDREMLARPAAIEFNQSRILAGGLISQGISVREYYHLNIPEIGELFFDVRGIKDAIAADKIRCVVMKAQLTERWVELIRTQNDVEEVRVAKLTPADLRRPGVAVGWPNGAITLIDGSHRLVKRFRLGLSTFRYVVVDITDLEPFTCLPGEEAKFFNRDRDPRDIPLSVRIERIEKTIE